MSKSIRTMMTAGAAALAINAGAAFSASAETYEITVKNLTYDQIFSPTVAIAHKRSVDIFETGEKASAGVIDVAENGSPATLVTQFKGNNIAVNGVYDPDAPAPGLILAGRSASFTLETGLENPRISIVGMLISTNDAFFGLDSARVGESGRTFTVPAYDAGSEINDEDCANIPGPFCASIGKKGNGSAGAEGGVVHIHRGIHGGVDLVPGKHDWRNPVAEITIRRIDD